MLTDFVAVWIAVGDVLSAAQPSARLWLFRNIFVLGQTDIVIGEISR